MLSAVHIVGFDVFAIFTRRVHARTHALPVPMLLSFQYYTVLPRLVTFVTFVLTFLFDRRFYSDRPRRSARTPHDPNRRVPRTDRAYIRVYRLGGYLYLGTLTVLYPYFS